MEQNQGWGFVRPKTVLDGMDKTWLKPVETGQNQKFHKKLEYMCLQYNLHNLTLVDKYIYNCRNSKNCQIVQYGLQYPTLIGIRKLAECWIMKVPV